MKRKDWKIKNLKEDIFDNSLRKKNILKKHLFLRRLFLYKNRHLYKLKKLSNFFFYKYFLKILKISYLFEKSFLLKFINKYLNILPLIIFKKKIFRDNQLNDFLYNNKLDLLEFNHEKNYKGNNIIIFDKNQKLSINYDNNLHKDIFLLKYYGSNINYILKDDINYNFNYNLYFFNNIEIYKINMYLYLNFIVNKK